MKKEKKSPTGQRYNFFQVMIRNRKHEWRWPTTRENMIKDLREIGFCSQERLEETLNTLKIKSRGEIEKLQWVLEINKKINETI